MKNACLSWNWLLMSSTSPWSDKFSNFFFNSNFLAFLICTYIKKRTVSMHLFVSQLICTSIHQPTANNVSWYIMTSFHSHLIPDSFHSRTIFLYSYQYQMQQEHLYKICFDQKKTGQLGRQNCILFLRQSFISSIFLSPRDIILVTKPLASNLIS